MFNESTCRFLLHLYQGIRVLDESVFTTFNQWKNDTLPSDTVQNVSYDGFCLAITTKSGKVLPKPYPK